MAKKTPRSQHTEVVCARIDKRLAFAVRLAAEADARETGAPSRLSDYIMKVLTHAAREKHVALDTEVPQGAEPTPLTATTPFGSEPKSFNLC